MDRYDLRILEALQQQGDMGPVEMSQVVNLSPSQCSRRMQVLRREGYVTGVRALVDPAKIRVGLQAYVLVTLKSHAPEAAIALRDRLLRLDEVIECQSLTGASDMIVKIATHDLKTFNRVLTDELLGSPEIAHAQSSIILEEIKPPSSLTLRYALPDGGLRN